MDCYVGMLGIFGFQWAPVNFAACNGAQAAIQQYQMLYGLIGSTYGGDNATYFQVPNLCGRKFVSQGPSSASGNYYTVGAFGGSEWTQLGQAQLPTHSHLAHFIPGGGGSAFNVQVSKAGGGHSTPAAGDYLASPTAAGDGVATYVSAGSQGVTVSLGGVSSGGAAGAVAVDPIGNGAAFSVMNSYLTMNVCICHTGIWPQRP